MKSLRKHLALLLLAALSGSVTTAAANEKLRAPYDRLNLSSQQSQAICDLDSQWKYKYGELHPQLQDARKKLFTLLAKPQSDPLEVTATQQRVNQLREQLSGFATQNYLKKRRLLTGDQQQQLEGWMRRMVADKLKSKGM